MKTQIHLQKKVDRKKLTIGFVMQSPDFGGAEEYALNLLNSFSVAGHTIIVAANKSMFHQEAVKNNFIVVPISHILDIMGNMRGLIKSIFLLPFMTIFYINLLKTFNNNHVDIILMSGFSEKLLVTALAPFFSIPVVWIEYGALEEVFKRNLYIPKLTYMLLDLIPYTIIVPTEFTKQRLMSDADVTSAHITVIPCGTTIPKSVSDKKSKKFVIGNISRLTREKGQDVLIRAFSLVVKQIPHAKLILVGGGPDENYYKRLIKNLNLKNNVEMSGFVSNVDVELKKMDIFVFPTVWKLEGFGLVTIEAMAHRLPVIASNIGPVPYILDNNVNGVLFKPGDHVDLANKIISLYLDEKRRNKIAEAGYKKVCKEYSLEIISKKILVILKEASKNEKNS